MWEKKLIKKVLINVNLDNIIISKLVKTKTNSKYLIGYLDELDKWVNMVKLKTFKVEDKNNKLTDKIK